MTSLVKSHSPSAKVTCSLPYRSIEHRICYESPYNAMEYVRVSDLRDSTLNILAGFTVTTDKHDPNAPRYDVVGVWVDSMLNRTAGSNASYYALFMKSLEGVRDVDAPYLVCIGLEHVETFPAIPRTVAGIAAAERRLFEKGIGLQENETYALLRCVRDAENEGKAGKVNASERYTLASIVKRFGDRDITETLEAFKGELLRKRF